MLAKNIQENTGILYLGAIAGSVPDHHNKVEYPSEASPFCYWRVLPSFYKKCNTCEVQWCEVQ